VVSLASLQDLSRRDTSVTAPCNDQRRALRRILVIERDGRTRALFQCRLPATVKTKSAACVEAALEKLPDHKFDLIVWMVAAESAAQANLAPVLDRLSTASSGTKTILFTDTEKLHGTPPHAGNVIFQKQPLNDDDLVSLVEDFLSFDGIFGATHSSRNDLAVPIEFEGMIIVGLTMSRVVRRIVDAAGADIPVVIMGETGTGKDLVAKAIHQQSNRGQRPYVTVNMGAMAPGLIASEIFGHERGAFTGAQEARAGIFEQANGGTVFLDEIGTMDEKTQISLLRVLEEKTFRRVGGVKNIGVDVRIIAASNEDLEKKVAEKRFREDLFYRLNAFSFTMPPLRERIGAVTVLTDHFVLQFAAAYGKEIERVSHETYRMLRGYSWPGNVRELKNVIQTAVLMADGKELTPELLPQRIQDAAGHRGAPDDAACTFPVGTTLDAVEKELIRRTLSHTGGNKKLAASLLGISRRALYNKIEKN
jgi:two-component system, NtrC family, response regulator AtoC